MKKWTKAERAEASRKGKERWAARKKRDVASFELPKGTVRMMTVSASGAGGLTGSGGGGGSANASAYSANETLAIDIVAMLRNEAIPSPLLLKVVKRILRP